MKLRPLVPAVVGDVLEVEAELARDLLLDALPLLLQLLLLRGHVLLPLPL